MAYFPGHMPNKEKRRVKRTVGYYDEYFERREGERIERNGNLTLVEDRETGEQRYLAPHELEY